MPNPPRRSPSRPDEAEVNSRYTRELIKEELNYVRDALGAHARGLVDAAVTPIVRKVDDLAEKMDDVIEFVRDAKADKAALARAEEKLRKDREAAFKDVRESVDVRQKQAVVIETAIDGTHKRRVGIVAAVIAVVTALGGLGVWSAISHFIH